MWAGTPISWMMEVTLDSRFWRAMVVISPSGPSSSQGLLASSRMRSTTDEMRQGFIM